MTKEETLKTLAKVFEKKAQTYREIQRSAPDIMTFDTATGQRRAYEDAAKICLTLLSFEDFDVDKMISELDKYDLRTDTGKTQTDETKKDSKHV